MNPKTHFKPILLMLLAILIICFVLVFAIRTLLPLAVAIFIAAFIDPLVGYLQKKTKLDRGLIVAVTLVGMFAGLGYIIITLGMRLIFELSKLVNTLPSYKHRYSEVIENISLRLIDIFEQIPQEAWVFLQDNFNQIMSTVFSSLSNFYSLIMNRLSMLPNLLVEVLIFVIFTFLFSYFISKDRHRITENIKKLFPETMQEKIRSFQIEILISFVRLIKAEMVLVSFSTLITILGFYLLKVDYALTLGIICGLLDMLPVVGPSLLFIPWMVFSVIMGNINYAIKLLILYIIILGSRQLLQPKIVGQNLGIDPLLSLVSIYLGVEFFGFLGLFIGPLVVVIVRSLIHCGLIPPLNRS